MKITKDSIRAMARHVWSGHKLIHDHELIHPERDWLIGLGSGVILTLAIIGWSAQLYITYRDNQQIISPDAQSDNIIYRAPLVESARSIISDRQQAAEALVEQGATPLLPALNTESPATTTEPLIRIDDTTTPTATTSTAEAQNTILLPAF